VALLPLAVGFVVSCLGSIPPTGPISLLVLHRALTGRPAPALAIAVGGALPEAGYSALTLWGVGHVVASLQWVRWVGPCMAAVMALLMVRWVWRGRPKDRFGMRTHTRSQSRPKQQRSLLRSFLLGLATAAVNVTLLFTWSATASLVHQVGWLRSSLDPLWLVPVGAFFGVVAWFALAVRLATWWTAKWELRFGQL
jgi:threonine/homoserine/homoserine lactone efflux protein